MDQLSQLFSLDGRVALVTGAGRGLGRSMSLALSAAGAMLALLDIDRSGAEETAELIRNQDGQAAVFETDITKPDQVGASLASVAEALGMPTILVNNAGITTNAPFESLPAQDWQRVIEVNLGGVFHMTQAVGGQLIDRGIPGSVINIGSISGLVGNRGGNNSHYCATKGGVHALTHSLAVEWAPHGLRVNSIAPGYFATTMTDKLKDRDPGLYQELIDRVPLGRFGRVEDLAGAVVFLASDASAYVTGHVLVIDGGYTAW